MNPLRVFPDVALRIPAREVTEFDEPGDKKAYLASYLINAMSEVAVNGGAVGLSAPQIGHATRVILLRDLAPTPKGREGQASFFAFLNPRIVSHSAETNVEAEGCLSLPGIRVDVERPVSIEMDAVDVFGEAMNVPLQGMEARIVQHEIDHLDGKLIVDYLEPHLWRGVMVEYRGALLRHGMFDPLAWGIKPGAPAPAIVRV